MNNEEVKIIKDTEHIEEFTKNKLIEQIDNEVEAITLMIKKWCGATKCYALRGSERSLAKAIQPLIERVSKEITEDLLAHCKIKIEQAIEKRDKEWMDGVSGMAIEQAKKQGFDEGVRKTTDAMDSTFSAQLEQAKQEVARGILSSMNMRDVGGVNPEWALSDKQEKEFESRYLGNKGE